jgi:hypothetical protein
MKLRVLFLRKNHILYLLLVIVTVVIALATVTSKGSAPAFNLMIGESTAIKADLTGDGVEDILYIKTQKDKYYIQVNAQDKSFYLEPARKIGTIGYNYHHWPMKVTLIDINRDKIPEIFVQAAQKSAAIQHVFMWTGSEFKDIHCSYSNIVGFFDTQSNKTPKFVSGNLTGNKFSLSYYMYIGSRLQSFNYENDIIPGKEAVVSFIRYIETLPEGEAYMPKDVFYPGLTGKDLVAIGKMSGDNSFYKFQDAMFVDTKVDKEGEISEIKWTLNFKGTPKAASKESKNYSLTVKLKQDLSCADRCFKIYNMILN